MVAFIGTTPLARPTICPAADLTPPQRQELALHTLSGRRPVKDLAGQYQVSRQFIYRQKSKAQAALAEAFTPEARDRQVLYWLPVTPRWIEPFVLGLLLVGHCPERGVMELAEGLLDYPGLSLGGIHNLMRQAAERAGRINQQEDLSGIAVAAFDEIYPAGKPVLGAVDVASPYCPLLSLEEHCDITTWGVRLLELSENRGLKLQGSVADGGPAFRAARQQVWPQGPCQGDVFHPLRDLQDLVRWLGNRARAAAAASVGKLEHQRQVLERDPSRALTGQRVRVSQKLTAARIEQRRAEQLDADVAVLARWMGQDVLGVAPTSLEERQGNWDFVLGELEKRGPLCPQRLGRLCRGLQQQQRRQLLLFASGQERQLAEAAEELGVPLHLVQAVAALEGLDRGQAVYWQRYGPLAARLGEAFGPVQRAVTRIAQDTCRASSLVENLNGRLRCCFFLRRHLSQPYLDLLRFYFNHHRLQRSRCRHRAGKTPWQLLSGSEHPHWLEMLTGPLFRRA